MSDTAFQPQALHQKPHIQEHTEIQKQEEEWFDLKPIEKKLCAYSLGLGIVLLIFFVILFEVVH